MRGKEREIVIMRSSNGEDWTEHPLVATEEAVHSALGGSLEGLNAPLDMSDSQSQHSLWSEHDLLSLV